MPPKGGSTKRKGGAAASVATPLTLYKRGLAAIKSWSPLTSVKSDAEALTALAACALQLQARMGINPPGDSDLKPEPQASTTLEASAGIGASVSAAPASASSGFFQNGNDGCVATTAQNGSAPAAAAVAGAVAVPAELLAAWAAVDALESGMALYGPVVRHSLDLDLEDWADEPGFLLASCHMELGKLLGRMWPRQEARELRHLGAAMELFPDFVAGGVALAQALLCRADHETDLQLAEQRLTRALAVAERLGAGGEDGEMTAADGAGAGAGAGLGPASSSLSMLLEANAACRREWQAGAAARRSLAMMMCQAGRDGEAAVHLAALEFTHRLARPVLHYPLDPLLAASSSCTVAPSNPSAAASPGSGYEAYVRAVDGALPPSLLAVLRAALGPEGRFWSEHGYGRVGYFSYMHELDAPALSAVHQAATLLHRLVVARFPAAAAARYAEWWAHCRRHPSGHQLHFDSDDEGAGGVRNPFVSAVIYLTGEVGGPTLVTPQLLGGPLAPHGWLVHPRENRVGMFDSTVLHGVIPGRGPSPRPGQHRITLMIAFWKDIQCRPRDDGLPGPSQPFPAPGSPAAGRYSWMADLPPHPDGPDGWGAADPRDATPTPIDRVWERIDGSPAQPGAVQYDACFQGF